MFSAPKEAGLQWLLGSTHQQRMSLSFWLSTTAIYGLSLVLQFYGSYLGLADYRHVCGQALLMFVGLTTIYLALRSGWSLRFADPALTLVQMVFAMAVLAFAYSIHPYVRGFVLMTLTLVLVFGAFTLAPAVCRTMGWVAVAVMGLTMGGNALLDPTRFPPRIEGMGFLFSTIMLPSVAHMAARLSLIRTQLRQQKRELREALERIHLLATRDELTGLPNRRHAMEQLEREERRTLRQAGHFCVALIDIDHFKRVNDSFGHAAGDSVLRLFARHCSAALRDVDLLARWGGEEFLLLMPDTPAEEGLRVIQRLHELLAEPQVWQDQPACQVTFSAGLAVHRAGELMQATVARADAALYQAKAGGRNRTVQA